MSLSAATRQRAFSNMLRRMHPSVASAASSSSVINSTSSTVAGSSFLLVDNNNNNNMAFQRRFISDDNSNSNSKNITHTKPSVDIAKLMPVGMSEMNNETLVTIAALGNHKARCEVLIRHVMSVDNVDYDTATATFHQIAQTNRNAVNWSVYPYFVGIGGGMIAAFASLPLVFDLNTAVWFNEFYVTTDIPEPRDLETMLEVGSWTWNWMEPPLGALSFSLLCLQYARAQLENLGLHPYTSQVINRRADTLAAAYPQYDPIIIRQYSKSDPLVKQRN